MARKKSASRRARTKEPAEAAEAYPTHDAFFKQTLADKGMAGRFMREHLPEHLVALMGPGDPIPMDTEFVDVSLRAVLSDKVLRAPLIAKDKLNPVFVLEAKATADRLAIAQVGMYCAAIYTAWYREERRKEREPQTQNEEKMPVLFGVIVHSGSSRYAHATELAQLAEPVPDRSRRYMMHTAEVVVVDLRAIRDDDLSAHPILRARLLVQKHATDSNLRENLDSLLRRAEIAALPEEHARDIIKFLSARVGGLDVVEGSLRRIETKAKADKIMSMTNESLIEEGRARERKATLAAKAETKALTAKLRQVLIAAVEQRLQRALSAEVRARIASASGDTLSEWLFEVAANGSLDSLLSMDSSSPSSGPGGPHRKKSRKKSARRSTAVRRSS